MSKKLPCFILLFIYPLSFIGLASSDAVDFRFPSRIAPNQGSAKINRSTTPFVRKTMPLRVMSFNTYQAGQNVANGLAKLAKHIALANADVIALQEIDQNKTEALLRYLGSEWTHCDMPQTYWLDTSIITKKRVIQRYTSANGFSNIGCQLKVNDDPPALVNVWNVHLNYLKYGPYTACLKSGDNLQEIMANEHSSPFEFYTSRVDSIVRLLNNAHMVMNRFQTHEVPLILTGDFNVPSMLDWTDSMKAHHCNWAVEWPVSRILNDNEFVDSYREIYSNPLYNPGLTWSPMNYFFTGSNDFLEPQDRIDFIYYKGTKMSAVSSNTYTGSQPIFYIPNHYNNDWPSDHAAVVTDFKLVL